MANPKFTLDESMQGAWGVLLENFWKYLGLYSLAVFLGFLPDIASSVCGMNSDWWLFSAFLSLMGGVLKAVLLGLGIYYVQAKLVRGEKATSDDLWKPAGKFWAYIGASIIYAWVVVIGCCFLIVPGIIFGIMFMFYPYFLAEHRLGPIQSLKASAAITSGAMWELFFLCLILILIKGVAPLAFIIGAVPAHLFAELAVAQAYRQLLNNTPDSELPFVYDRGRFSHGDTVEAPLHWDDSMGYDDPGPAAATLAFEQKTDGERINTSTAEKIVVPTENVETHPSAAHLEADDKSQTVDNNAPENDKSGQ